MTRKLEADVDEVAWTREINPDDYGITSWNPGGDARGQVVIALPKDADDALVDDLQKNLDSQGMERQLNTVKFWTTTGRVRPIKLKLAAKIVRRWREECLAECRVELEDEDFEMPEIYLKEW